MTLLKPVEDTKQSLTQDLILITSGILVGAAIGDPTGLAAGVISRIGSEVITRIILPLTSPSESKRLYQWGKQAAEGIAQGLEDGEEFRKDGFFAETPTNRSNFEEVVESTLKKVMDATDEPKIKFMASLTKNIHLNQDLDMDTYRQILNDLDELSYRQLCIIRLIVLYRNNKVDIDAITDIEQVPQNERTGFYSLGRDYEYLMDNHYIWGVPLGRNLKIHDPFLDNPGQGSLPDSTERFHQFANLDEIPPEDIEKYFSIWQVRVHKSEE